MPNRIMRETRENLDATLRLRTALINALTNDDLRFALPNNPTLGELCWESGAVEQAYIEGFRTFQQQFSPEEPDMALAMDIERLKTWYADLDSQLIAALEALSDDDLARPVERGYGYAPMAEHNFHVYREAVLMFYSKAHVYLKALGKADQISQQWTIWIGSLADIGEMAAKMRPPAP